MAGLFKIFYDRNADNNKFRRYFEAMRHLKKYYKMYQHGDFERGGNYAIQWTREYRHPAGLTYYFQSRVDNRFTQLVAQTCSQEQMYQYYDLQEKYESPNHIGVFLSSLRLHKTRESMAKQKLVNDSIRTEGKLKDTEPMIPKIGIIAQSIYKKQDEELKKELEQKEKNNLKIMNEKQKALIDAEGEPTVGELALFPTLRYNTNYDCLKKEYVPYKASCSVSHKMYGYYWVLCINTLNGTRMEDAIVEKFDNKEDAARRCDELYNKQLNLILNELSIKQNQTKLKEDAEKEKKEKEVDKIKEQADKEIEHVRSAMGIGFKLAQETIDGDIF